MSVVVPIIVVGIIIVQLYFLRKNVRRMDDYCRIFDRESSWGISHNPETGFVNGIVGEGNEVFLSIKDSINKYLANNSGSVIDFQLLKDAVDRHCDSVENDVNTLTPIPLYCGLAGTMAGVIVGLFSLLGTGSITALLSSGSSSFGMAAVGVNDLLSGVAWAMFASICGIIFTTWASILFKSRKIRGEAGKNTFLAWLQARLLPELPSDTSDALNRLVKNLNRFNGTFAENTAGLRDALREVNGSYRIQADIIKAVHDMDVMKMARANVQVLRELKACTDKLEQFNLYLDGIHGYTDAIHTFTSQFEAESNRLHVLEEIQQFFARHKAEIAKDSADVDVALSSALRTIKESASSNSSELNKVLTEQAETFKRIIREEKESFEQLSGEMKSRFSADLGQMPMLGQKLSDISAIPAKLDSLIERMERSNAMLGKKVESAMETAAARMAGAKGSAGGYGGTTGNAPGGGFPGWMRWTIVVSAVIVALACIANTAHGIFYGGASGRADSVFVRDTLMTVDTIYVKVRPAAPDTAALDNGRASAGRYNRYKSMNHNRRRHAK